MSSVFLLPVGVGRFYWYQNYVAHQLSLYFGDSLHTYATLILLMIASLICKVQYGASDVKKMHRKLHNGLGVIILLATAVHAKFLKLDENSGKGIRDIRYSDERKLCDLLIRSLIRFMTACSTLMRARDEDI